jgi:hypothetical protein
VQANSLAGRLLPYEGESRSWTLVVKEPGWTAMKRFVHRIIMSVLLVAALVLIWNVLGAR